MKKIPQSFQLNQLTLLPLFMCIAFYSISLLRKDIWLSKMNMATKTKEEINLPSHLTLYRKLYQKIKEKEGFISPSDLNYIVSISDPTTNGQFFIGARAYSKESSLLLLSKVALELQSILASSQGQSQQKRQEIISEGKATIVIEYPKRNYLAVYGLFSGFLIALYRQYISKLRNA